MSDSEQQTGGPGHAWARGWMSDSSQLLVSQDLTVIAPSFAAIMIARTLDPDDWGVFSAFLGLSMALTLVADFGIGTWLLRELSRLHADAEGPRSAPEIGRLASSGVVVNVAIALPLIVAGVVWTTVARPGVAVSFALIALLGYGMLTAGANALEACLRARRWGRLPAPPPVGRKRVLILAP